MWVKEKLCQATRVPLIWRIIDISSKTKHLCMATTERKHYCSAEGIVDRERKAKVQGQRSFDKEDAEPGSFDSGIGRSFDISGRVVCHSWHACSLCGTATCLRSSKVSFTSTLINSCDSLLGWWPQINVLDVMGRSWRRREIWGLTKPRVLTLILEKRLGELCITTNAPQSTFVIIGTYEAVASCLLMQNASNEYIFFYTIVTNYL